VAGLPAWSVLGTEKISIVYDELVALTGPVD